MATFDVAGAKAAGYSDADIAAAMAAGPSGAPSDTNVATAQNTPRGNFATPGPKVPLGRQLLRGALEAAPTVGGAIGGMIGGAGGTVAGMGVGGVPGAVGGAALGGAGGEAVKQLGERAFGFSGAPNTPGEAATNIASEGAIQGLSEGGGQALMAGGRLLAPALAKAALRYPIPKSIRSSFPHLNFADELLGRGVTSEAGSEAGRTASAETAGKLVEGASTKNAASLNIAANQSPDDVRWIIRQNGGLAYGPKNFLGTSQVRDLMEDLFAHSSAPAEAKNEVKTYLTKWTADNANRVTPQEWYDAAKGLQQEARATYKGTGVGTAGQAMDSPVIAETKQKLAAAIKARLGSDINGLTAADRTTQAHMALEDAFERSENTRAPWMSQMLPLVAGAGAGGALGASGHMAAALPATLLAAGAAHSASNPTNLARMALLARGLRTTAGQDVLRQGVRAPVLLSQLLTQPGGSQ